MKVKVQWIIDGFLEVEAASNEAAEALVDEKLRRFIIENSDLTEVLGATAIQGHAVTKGQEN
ncbi:hypothetical protein N8500_07535 [Candidatus Puniceispirillum sp.]|nr:hypothetical protein [Candidatus Puniceispirillum sp.]